MSMISMEDFIITLNEIEEVVRVTYDHAEKTCSVLHALHESIQQTLEGVSKPRPIKEKQ